MSPAGVALLPARPVEHQLRAAFVDALSQLAHKHRQLNELLCDKLLHAATAGGSHLTAGSVSGGSGASSSLPSSPTSQSVGSAARAAGGGVRSAFSKIMSSSLPAGLQLPSTSFRYGSYQPPPPVMDPEAAAAAGASSSAPSSSATVNQNVLGSLGQHMTGAVSNLTSMRGTLFGRQPQQPARPADPRQQEGSPLD